MLYLLLLAGAGFAVGGIAVGITFRKKKTPAEKERERRLKVNAIGRICDGTIVEVTSRQEQGGAAIHLLHYHYSVGGVNYSAAQDISLLRDAVRVDHCTEGTPTSVKYDPRNPSNSIVICESWGGLRAPRAGAATLRGGLK